MCKEFIISLIFSINSIKAETQIFSNKQKDNIEIIRIKIDRDDLSLPLFSFKHLLKKFSIDNIIRLTKYIL